MPYKDVQQLELRIIQYFTDFECRLGLLYAQAEECPSLVNRSIEDRNKEPPTLSGLAYALGYDSRAAFEKQARGKSKIAPVLRRARLIVEATYEKNLHKASPSGSIFALKNMGWNDGKEAAAATEGKGSKTLNVVATMAEVSTSPSEREVVM